MKKYNSEKIRADITKLLSEYKNLPMMTTAKILDIPIPTFIYHAKKLGLYAPNQGRKGFKKTELQQASINRRTVPLEEVLEGKHPSYDTGTLKRRLVQNNILKYECTTCKIKEWYGKNLSLQINHIDGNHTNHILSNLEFLCPNCHSLTITFGSKNSKRYKAWKQLTDDIFIQAFIKTGSTKGTLRLLQLNYRNMVLYKHVQDIIKKYGLVSQLAEDSSLDLEQYQFESDRDYQFKPKFSKEILKDLLWKLPTTKIANIFNMSDNGVARWAKKWNLEKPARGYWQ